MSKKKWIFSGLLLLGMATGCGSADPQHSLAATLVSAAPNSGTASSTSLSSTTSLSSEELNFLNKINALRAHYGVAALSINPVLQHTAREHSSYMNSLEQLTHDEPSPNLTSSDRIENAGGEFNYSGENIASGSAFADDTYLQWFYSAGHFANMVNANYQYIGISVNGVYWTTDFGGR